jgi:hypothetical protein
MERDMKESGKRYIEADRKIFKQYFGCLLKPFYHSDDVIDSLHYTRTFWAYSKHLVIHLYSINENGIKTITLQILYHSHNLKNNFLETLCEDLDGAIDLNSGYLIEYRLDVGFGDPKGFKTVKRELHIILCRIYLHEAFDDKVMAVNGSKWKDFDIPEYEGYAKVQI